MSDKIPINGLKLSGQLIVLYVDAQIQPPPSARLPRLCRLLAQHQINIAYLTTAGGIDSQPDLCCIDTEDLPAAIAAIEEDANLQPCVRIGESVGLITFYPHHSSLKLIGKALQALSEGGIRIHGLASSISALSVLVDFERLDRAGELLDGCFQMPVHASPYKAEFKVRQKRRPA